MDFGKVLELATSQKLCYYTEQMWRRYCYILYISITNRNSFKLSCKIPY